MNSINLYVLCQGTELECFDEYQMALRDTQKMRQSKKEEIATLKAFVSQLLLKNVDLSALDNFFFRFSIPQISKEFDLLKIYEKGPVINIELKSQEVAIEKIEYQLKKNRYYLSHLKREIYSFTYIKTKSGGKVYSYDGETLKECGIESIISVIKNRDKCINSEIELLFRAKDYLISPINTPKLFVDKKYYLTSQQEEIRNKILQSINNGEHILWGIQGKAGTGKTLLLYDIARILSDNKKVCVIHSGILAKGHMILNSLLTNVDIISAKDCNKEKISKYDCILVDESQRLHQENFDCIIQVFQNSKKNCVFSYDYYQVLSYSEENRNIPKQLQKYDFFRETNLSQKIRTNVEVSSFIKNMINLSNNTEQHMNYENIEVIYAKDYDSAKKIVSYYVCNKDFEFISYTPSSIS